MKTIQFFLAIILFGLFTDCSNNDDLPANFTTWSLINVSGGFAGVDHTFENGLITWRFYDQDGVLEIANNNPIDSLIDLFESGSYTYSIQDEGTEYHIYIDDMDLGTITKTSREIIIHQPVDDGFIITLRR